MSDRIPLSRLRSTTSARFLTEESQRSPQDIDQLFPNIPQDITADETGPAWKKELYALLEHPTSSQSAFIIHILMTGLIILSAIITVLETGMYNTSLAPNAKWNSSSFTVPSLHYISPRFWFGLETMLVALFTVEYAARCIAWSSTWKNLFQWVTCMSHCTSPLRYNLFMRLPPQHFMAQ